MIYVLAIAGLLVGIVIGALAGPRKSKVALAVAQQRLADLAQQIAGEKIQTQTLRDSLADSERNLAAARTQFAAAERNLVEQRGLISHAEEQ